MGEKKGKTITISPELEERIVESFMAELDYHIYESGCVDEYQTEINTQIDLLRLLGHTDLVKMYEKDNKDAMKDRQPEWMRLYDFLFRYADVCGYNLPEAETEEEAFEVLCEYFDNDVEEIRDVLKELSLVDLYRDQLEALEKEKEKD